MLKLIKYLVIGMSALICTSCGFIKGSSNAMVNSGIKIADKAYVEDNYIENSIEDVIESITSIQTDLSPNSEEADGRWSK